LGLSGRWLRGVGRKDLLETFAEPFRRYMKAIDWEEGTERARD